MDTELIEQTDEALMLAYIKGDHQAFDALYHRHKGGLYRYFLRQCRPPENAQELYQDCWLKVIANSQQYKVEAKFSTWLYTLAHHHLVDWYRRKSVRSIENEDEEQIEMAPSLQMPESEFQQQQLKKELIKAVENLPLNQRNIFLLHEQGGLTVAQIAEVTGDKKEAVKSRYRYAIQKLRQTLGGLK